MIRLVHKSTSDESVVWWTVNIISCRPSCLSSSFIFPHLFLLLHLFVKLFLFFVPPPPSRLPPSCSFCPRHLPLHPPPLSSSPDHSPLHPPFINPSSSFPPPPLPPLPSSLLLLLLLCQDADTQSKTLLLTAFCQSLRQLQVWRKQTGNWLSAV